MYASCREDLANPAIDSAERAHLEAKATALSGMSVRDYFAGKALQGLVASCTNGQEVAPGLGAKWCYEMADAMLEARNA